MQILPLLGTIILAFGLGARHGLDWDHLAAIADLVGSPEQRTRRSIGLAFWYCIGHGLIIILLGAMVGLLGVRLPGALDHVFEVVVGLTLVALGLIVLWQVWQQRVGYLYTSRWRLLIDLLKRTWLRRRGTVEWDAAAPLSKRIAFGIGVLHGTGAETPTQVVLFSSAAVAGTSGGAGLVLAAFVVGLILSDVGVALIWVSGRMSLGGFPGGQLALGLLTGVASLGVGVTFVLQKSSLLPSLIGG